MFGKALGRFRRQPAASFVTVEVGDPANDVPGLLHWADRALTPRMVLPVAMMTMQGAWSYADRDHPFVAGLRDGPASLEAFYARFRPANLREVYGLAEDGPGADLPPWTLPWLNQPRRPPKAEGGLEPEDGVSLYGPVSARKVALEHRRLSEAKRSVVASGYRPDRFGDIDGQFLRNGDDYRFLVRGGKHRAAVLAHLGWKAIPVVFRPSWARVADIRDAADWPLVRSGEMSEPMARAVFLRYFDPPGKRTDEQ